MELLTNYIGVIVPSFKLYDLWDIYWKYFKIQLNFWSADHLVCKIEHNFSETSVVYLFTYLS